jgi:hypothetical protein
MRNCAARRRDGAPCASRTSSRDSEFCSDHEQLVELYGEEDVRASGSQATESPPGGAADVDRDGSSRGERERSGLPAEVRPRLAALAAASLDSIQRALLDSALGASREHWITPVCPDCGKKHRVQVQVPDVRARVAAERMRWQPWLATLGSALQPRRGGRGRRLRALTPLALQARHG